MNDVLINCIAVACGSGLGGVLRYLVTLAFSGLPGGGFPYGTFVVNVTGCLAIGLISGLLQRVGCADSVLRLFLTVGVCGGFTTFSTFANENFQMFSSGQFIVGVFYIVMSVVIGFGATALGYYIMR